jgi:hypothetical protein
MGFEASFGSDYNENTKKLFIDLRKEIVIV